MVKICRIKTNEKYKNKNSKKLNLKNSEVYHEKNFIYYKFNIQDLKTVLYRYSLKISGINVRFKVQEHDDGYQEFYLAKSIYKEIKDCTHTWDRGEVIVGESTIETVHGKKATGYFEKDYKVNLSKDDLPASNELYFYIGAHGKGNDKWTCSEVSVKFLLERK